jgi:YVTN family beta-propeller protein
LRVRVRLVGRLPSPVQDPATTPLPPDEAVLFGGLDQADTSTASIVHIRAGVARSGGALPSALHDAAATTVAGRPYLFGGGNLGSSAAILRGGRSQVGVLPVAASDVAAASVDGVAYIVGGYDGARPLDTIVAWRPGHGARVVAHLPQPLRYAAVTSVGGKVLIAGGTSGIVAQRAILRFDPVTRQVRRIGRMPKAVTHAAAGTVAGRVLVLGGRRSGLATQSRQITAVDPVSGQTAAAGRLPVAMSDFGAATLGDRVVLAGGRDRGGTVRDEVYEVAAAHAVRTTKRRSTALRAGHIPPLLRGSDVYAADRPGRLSRRVRRDPARVYVPDSASNTVDVIDQRTFKVIRHFAVGEQPQHITPSWDLSTLWVSNDKANSVTAIDPRTSRPGRTVAVADPYNLYFNASGTRAIVVAEALQRLDFRDPRTMRLRHSLHVRCNGIDHMDFNITGRVAVASCEFSGRLAVIDLRAQRVVGYIPLRRSAMPQDVKLSPDGHRFFVADMSSGGVWVIDAHRFVKRGYISTGRGAHGLYVSRDSKRLFVTNRGEGTISVLGANSGHKLRTWRLPGGGSPDMGGLSASGRVLWLSGRYDAEVYAISTRTGHLLHRIRVGSGPHGLCVWPQPGRYSIGHTGILR